MTFKTRNGFMLPDEAKSLVPEHCLYENGKSYTLYWRNQHQGACAAKKEARERSQAMPWQAPL